MSKMVLTLLDKKTKKNADVGSMEIRNSTGDAEKGELYLYGDIVSDQWSKWTDDDTCPQDITDFLNELDRYKDIDIYINSGGGSVFAGIAIYNQLKRHEGFKTVHIDGLAASIASIIACAGDRVLIPKASQFMIHKPTCMYFCTSLNAEELRKEADVLDTCQKSITSIYMDNVQEGITEDKITELIDAETWFTGEDITDVFDFEVDETAGEIAACTSRYFDRYKHVPQGLKGSFLNTKNKENHPGEPEMDDDTKALVARIKAKKQAWEY